MQATTTPVTKPHASAHPQPNPKPNNKPNNKPNAKPNTTVFIVDDSALIRERLVKLLGDVDGLVVVGEAASAASAIAGIFGTMPDSVVLDVHLDGGSGLDVLRKVHPQLPEVHFVVLTNHPSVQYRRAYMAAGASFFLDKSSEFEKVAGIVSAHGNSPRQADYPNALAEGNTSIIKEAS